MAAHLTLHTAKVLQSQVSRLSSLTSRSSLTAGSAVATLLNAFDNAKLPDSELSANCLVAACFGLKQLHSAQHNALSLDRQQLSRLDNAMRRRINREPLQYILGEWDFRDCNLTMRAPVFIPRPETESLVDLAVSAASEIDKERKVESKFFCEIGVGSGAVTLCLLRELAMYRAVCFDILPAACQLTVENLSLHSLLSRAFVFNGKLLSNGSVPGLNCRQFDLVVSNPPYVPDRDLLEHRLQPELKFESELALRGGGQLGMEAPIAVAKFGERRVRTGGFLVMEIDVSQSELMAKSFNRFGALELQSIEKDFAGRDRFCVFKKL